MLILLMYIETYSFNGSASVYAMKTENFARLHLVNKKKIKEYDKHFILKYYSKTTTNVHQAK